ncbi:chorismate mutase [Sulfolobus sp. A20]|uniref:chorismate mutase n=1 Tax=Saccharolobus sp. A20 TaxID=1891280 RepID=UPI00084607B7|nr:chorismate mutase [Sulfolobus sp. A20]TRM76645.1 chorismate mutase [Sulfolobus sp. A20-N-F8]TRM79295.1 chorismate mutase [Sulfolobus sp. B5]TRM82153.1 chorismate mutase [Sulfolobus sp. D5]TRM99899.1 chorismate mutase [Sulfolobus sp. F1]AOL16075.1 chorismate mutase [Sulfolobus sp. A20]
MSGELAKLRQEIDKIDEQIIKLFALRLELSRKIGKIKAERNNSITDESRENKVRENWLVNSRKYGIPQSFVESVLPVIFSYSKLMQINVNEKEKIVVYGYGGMARSLVSILSLAGHEIAITGRDINKAEMLAKQFNCVSMNPLEATGWGEIFILAIPPDVIVANLSDFIGKLSNKILMDISSSKSIIFKYLEEFSKKAKFKFVSTHPLFGPIDYPVGERIVIIPSENSTKDDIVRVEKLWRDAGLVPVITDVETHEKAMAIVQVLSHYYLLGLSDSISLVTKELNVDISNFHTTNFREIFKVLSRVNEIKDIILEIQRQNPYAYKVRSIGLEVLKKLKQNLDGETK